MIPEFIKQFDYSIAYFFLNFAKLPLLVNYFFQSAGSIQIHLIVFSFLFVRFYHQRDSRLFFLIPLIFRLLILFTVLYFLKISVARLRPEFDGWEVDTSLFKRLFDTRMHSFPSSHAALAGFYAKEYPKSRTIRIFCYLISLSRIVSLQHFFSDVVGGFFIGNIINTLSKACYNFFLKKTKMAIPQKESPFFLNGLEKIR